MPIFSLEVNILAGKTRAWPRRHSRRAPRGVLVGSANEALRLTKRTMAILLASILLEGCDENAPVAVDAEEDHTEASPADIAENDHAGVTITSDTVKTLTFYDKYEYEVTRWTLRNSSGAGLTVMELGATVMSLEVPDKDGNLKDVVFGFDGFDPYSTDSSYFGAIVGRYANRIANGKFSLDGKTYSLPINDPPNSLHGGEVGFDKKLWHSSEQVETAEGPGVRFFLQSEDGDQGYPGKVWVTVTYVWTENNRLIVDYSAITDAPTPFNVAQHIYWNLAGADATSILDHELRLNADAFTPVDATLIPTGEIVSVEGTPFDFRKAKPIGLDIGADSEQLAFGDGFDHNWVLNGFGMREVAWLHDPKSGRVMAISTDQPGIQFYSGNFLDGTVVGKRGIAYSRRSGLCLETQHFPDSPNHSNFPDTILKSGEAFSSRTVFDFGVYEPPAE